MVMVVNGGVKGEMSVPVGGGCRVPVGSASPSALPPAPPAPPPPPPLPPPLPLPLSLPLPAPPPADPALIAHVLNELKAEGFFDQFRKDCIADVDTKPAYQNLRQRVESTVAAFLSLQKWSSDSNKNQLREKVRKHILDSNFLDQGVERIVDQVVNPKIAPVFIPQVEEIVSKSLGLKKPERSKRTFNGNHDLSSKFQEYTDDNLLPNDLESVSPESVKSQKTPENKSVDNSVEKIDPLEISEQKLSLNEKEDTTLKVENKSYAYSEDSENSNDEELESPAFEPLETNFKEEGHSKDSHLSGISDLTSHESNISSSVNENKIDSEVLLKNTDPQNSDSQLFQVSNDSNISLHESNAKTSFKNSFSNTPIKDNESSSTVYPIQMEVIENTSNTCYKFNDDNASDARQYFEESVKKNMGVDKKMAFNINDDSTDDSYCKDTSRNINNEIPKSTSGSETNENIPQCHRESIESKTSTDSTKAVYSVDMSMDSNESNSVFTPNPKGENDHSEKKVYSFENKIAPMSENSMDNIDSSNNFTSESLREKSEIDNAVEHRTEIEKLVTNSESENDYKHKEEGGNYKRLKEKDKYRDGSRDKRDDSRHHSRSSHSKHSSSRKHSYERKHSSHDKRGSSSSKNSTKDSDVKSKERHEKSSNGDSKRDSHKDRHKYSSHRSSTSHGNSKQQCDEISKQNKQGSEKVSSEKQSHKEHDKHKEKSVHSKYDKLSESGNHREKSSTKHEKSSRSNSSVEKKNDEKKSKHKSGREESCSSSKIERTRRSTDRDSNDGSGGATKGPNVNSSGGNMQSVTKSKSTSGNDNSNGNYSSGQSDTLNKDTVNITSGSYIKSEFDMFQFGNLNAIKRHSISEKLSSNKQSENKNVEHSNVLKSPPSDFSEKSLSPKSPEKLSPKISEKSLSNMKSPLMKLSEKMASSLGKPDKVTNRFDKNIKSDVSQNIIEEIANNKLCDIPNKKPIIHIDSQLKPINVEEVLIVNNSIKKPKCASNLHEAMKVMKIRRKIEKLELKKKREEILKIEREQNISKGHSRVYSDPSGPELLLTYMKDEDEKKPQISNMKYKDRTTDSPESDLKYFDFKNKEKLTYKIDKLEKYILKLEKEWQMNDCKLNNVKNHGEKNGLLNKMIPSQNKILTVSVQKIDLLNSEIKISVNCESTKSKNIKENKTLNKKIDKKKNTTKTYLNDSVNNIKNVDSVCEYDKQYYDKMNVLFTNKSEEDIMEIILGRNTSINEAVVSFNGLTNNHRESETMATNLKRKRSSVSASSSSNSTSEDSNENLKHNNNLSDDLQLNKKKKYLDTSTDKKVTKTRNLITFKASESGNLIENHVNGNISNIDSNLLETCKELRIIIKKESYPFLMSDKKEKIHQGTFF